MNLLLTILSFLWISGLMVLGPDPGKPPEPYPQDYFSMPVDRAVLLSGTFGELRSNHFHAGLDIKSRDGRVGEHIFASAKGYVSRIKVQPGGYGRALYLTHPNGYITVYAHLHRFSPELEAYVKRQQYQREQFSVDLYPGAGQFTYDKGAHIGYLGNSGSSSGPHLHFEIRDANQVPHNPLLFGLQIHDARNPLIRLLRIYQLNDDLQTRQIRDIWPRQRGAGQYVIPDTLLIPAWQAGFGIKAYDQMTGAPNQNGIYKLEMYVDDVLQYGFSMDRIPFSKSRYLNAHIDYAHRVLDRGYINRCFALPGNALDIYDRNGEAGIVKLFKDKPRKVLFRISDKNGNQSDLLCFVKRDTQTQASPPLHYTHIIKREHAFQIWETHFQVEFAPETFYEDIFLDFNQVPDQSDGVYSDMYQLHDASVPVHKYFTLRIVPDRLPASLRSKAFIARCLENGSYINCGGETEGDFITTQVRTFGHFCIMTDTVPPVIKPVLFSSNMASRKLMQFRITDSVRTGGVANGLSYRATVDGKWILMEYDAKRDLLTHYFDDHIPPGKHELVLTVKDDRKNIAQFRKNFIR